MVRKNNNERHGKHIFLFLGLIGLIVLFTSTMY
jgi:hypothetical protein